MVALLGTLAQALALEKHSEANALSDATALENPSEANTTSDDATADPVVAAPVSENSLAEEAVKEEEEAIRVGVVTWNMAERSPTARDCRWLRSLRDCSLVVCCAQELEELKPRRREARRRRRVCFGIQHFGLRRCVTLCSQRIALPTQYALRAERARAGTQGHRALRWRQLLREVFPAKSFERARQPACAGERVFFFLFRATRQ